MILFFSLKNLFASHGFSVTSGVAKILSSLKKETNCPLIFNYLGEVEFCIPGIKKKYLTNLLYILFN